MSIRLPSLVAFGIVGQVLAASNVGDVACPETQVASLLQRQQQRKRHLDPEPYDAQMRAANDTEDPTRLLSPIGAWPCCPTPPYCKAPTCKYQSPLPPATVICTATLPKVNLAYMTDPKMYYAYIANGGGSMRLDYHKHWDVLGHLLGCYDNSSGLCEISEPFDLAVDLGADSGGMTADFAARRLAKDYIMVDAVPALQGEFQRRVNASRELSQTWFNTTLGWPHGKKYPSLEFLNFALSNETKGSFDACTGPQRWSAKSQGIPSLPCPVPVVSLDTLIPGRLTPLMQDKFSHARSLYLKTDLDGMDQLTLDGGRRLLTETRGLYSDGRPRHLVNFIMFEFCPACMEETREMQGFAEYDLETNVRLLASLGFEAFLIGPRYIPISGASWLDDYKQLVPGLNDMQKYTTRIPGGTIDIFAMRASHPRSGEIKLALGACNESHDFTIGDDQYVSASAKTKQLVHP